VSASLAWRQRRYHGLLGRYTAGAAVRPYRRGHGDDSASSLGSTSVTIQFDLSRDIDGAARDVEAAINAARSYLPANLPSNPTYRKVNPADAPIMILGLTSDKFGPDKLYDEASTVIEQKLSQIPGVGQVNVGGGALPSVRVDANPDASWPATA
jgi:multidrug efflux pump